MNNLSVTIIDSVFQPTAGDTRPFFIQDGTRALLYFNGRREPGGDEERVVAVFSGCLASRFGYPNDEALAGHPLYKAGVGFYGVFEVNDSSWMNEVITQNGVCFPNFSMPKRRHIIITMQDETFECLAKGFEIQKANEISFQALFPNFDKMD